MLQAPSRPAPLLFFSRRAQRLPLITMGLLFYLNPAMQMPWSPDRFTSRCPLAGGSLRPHLVRWW